MKEIEKVDKYGDLNTEIAKMWLLRESNIKVIPVLIGALGSIPHDLKNKHLETKNTLQFWSIAKIRFIWNGTHTA